MNSLQLFHLFPLTAAIVTFLLTIFVLSQNLRSLINWVFALWGISITVWNMGTFVMFQVSSEEDALPWARFLQLGVIFLPPSLFHLCTLVAQVSLRGIVRFLYFVHVLFAVSLFTGDFIDGVRKIDYPGFSAYWSKAGPFYGAFIYVYALCSCATMALLWYRQRAVPPIHRARLKWMMLANGILIVFGANDLLPILGVYHYPFFGEKTHIYPLGSAAAIFYGLMVGYSVLQHQLLDIRVTLSRFAAQGIRMLFMLLVGLALLLLTWFFNAEKFNSFSFFSSLAVLGVTALIASILFPRFFGSGEETLERRILGDHFEYHDKIQGFIRSIPWYSETSTLLQDFQDLLVKTIKVKSYQMILVDESSRAFSLYGSYTERPPIQLPNLHRDSPVFDLFRNSKRDYLTFNSLYAARESELERAAKEALAEFEPDFCFPFLSDDDPFGLLLIGSKINGEPYTPHDLHLLTLLVKNLGSVINQIRLKNQVLQAEELELLGRMSRGMAHDLNNLLTPVSTYLQLSNGPGHVRLSAEELLPTAMRNLDTMHAYIREALFFSRHHTLQIEESRLNQLVHTCVDLADQKLTRKKMVVVIGALPEVHIEMDGVLIQRLVGNIISNAIDASPPGSKIRVELFQLAKTETSRDWWRLMIIDEGEGISKANLRRIMNPYFTTKDQGDKDRGFGLGLAICRKIIHLHGGNLNIASEEKKGTTVQVDLPSRQIKSNHTPNVKQAAVAHS